jgi:hypothetical protein
MRRFPPGLVISLFGNLFIALAFPSTTRRRPSLELPAFMFGPRSDNDILGRPKWKLTEADLLSYHEYNAGRLIVDPK